MDGKKLSQSQMSSFCTILFANNVKLLLFTIEFFFVCYKEQNSLLSHQEFVFWQLGNLANAY